MHDAKPEAAKRSTLFTIFFLSYFSSFGNPLIIPLYSQIMNHFQISPLEISLLVSLYALPGACVIPVLGFLQDRIGRRPVLLGALMLCVVGSFGLAVSDSFSMFLFCRVLQGLSVTPLEALGTTLITDNFSGEARVRNIGRNASILYVGVATFPLLSTAMMYLFGWRAALLLPCILGLPLILLCLRMPMPYHSTGFQWDGYRKNLRQVLASAKLLSLFGIRIWMALIMFGIIHTYLPFLITDKLNGAAHLPGIYFALYSGMLAVGSLSLGWFIARFSARFTGMGSNIVQALGIVCFLLAPNVQALVPPMLLYGFASGTLMALVVANIAQSTTPDTRGTVLSLASTVFRAAQALSPLICGLLFSLGGFNLMYGLAALATLAMLTLTRVAFRPRLVEDSSLEQE